MVVVVAGLVGDRLQERELAGVVQFLASGPGRYVHRAKRQARAGRLKPTPGGEVVLARERQAAVGDAMVFAHQDRHSAVAPSGAVLGTVAELLQALVGEVAERAACLLQAHHVGALPAQHLRDARHTRSDPVYVPADDPEPS